MSTTSFDSDSNWALFHDWMEHVYTVAGVELMGIAIIMEAGKQADS